MKDLEKTIHQYLKKRKWDNLRPSDIAKSIMIEGAELLELFQWDNLSLEEVKRDKEKIGEIEKELADVFIYALEMAILLGFDTEKVIRDKLTESGRKYPAKVMRQRQPGNPDYWRIKKEHRRKKR